MRKKYIVKHLNDLLELYYLHRCEHVLLSGAGIEISNKCSIRLEQKLIQMLEQYCDRIASLCGVQPSFYGTAGSVFRLMDEYLIDISAHLLSADEFIAVANERLSLLILNASCESTGTCDETV